MTEQTLTNPTDQTSGAAGGLADLVRKYGKPEVVAKPEQARDETYERFDTDSKRDRKTLERISKGAGEAGEAKKVDQVVEGQAEMAKLQLRLATLADEYGELKTGYKAAIGKQRFLEWKELMKVWTYENVPGLRSKEKAIAIKDAALDRNGRGLVELVNRMANVLTNMHGKAADGITYAMKLKVDNITFQGNMDSELIERLQKGHYTTSDQARAEKEARRIADEITEFDGVIGKYETDIKAAKQTGDMDGMKKLVGEVTQVLEMKRDLLDGKRMAEDVDREIRREILDSAYGVDSAKGAISMAKANYEGINSLIDTFTELEMMYRYALSDFIPIFKEQAELASQGKLAASMKDVLSKSAEISNDMVDVSNKMLMGLASRVFDMIQNPVYDVKAMEEKTAYFKAFTKELNDRKMKWAGERTTVIGQSYTDAQKDQAQLRKEQMMKAGRITV